VWREGGADAARVFLLQQLDAVLRRALEVPRRVRLGHVHLVDSGDGATVSALANAYPDTLRRFLERVREMLGVDVAAAVAAPRGGEDRP